MAPLEDSTAVPGATTLDAFSVTFPDQVEQELGAAYSEPHWTNIKHALARPYVPKSHIAGKSVS